MDEKEKKFWTNLAIYKGKEYQYISYGNGKIELYSTKDIRLEKVLYTVIANDLEDRYTKITHAILDGVSYVVYEIDNDIVTYKRFINDNKYISKSLKDFEMVYEQKNHQYNNQKYVEKEIVYIDVVRIDKEAVNRKFWAEEMASGNLMLSVSDDVLSINDLENALSALYDSRISDKGGFPDALLWDEYIAWLNIDNIRFDISSDWGIVTISPEDSRGNQYIREIVDYLNRNI